jgi:hypothetical protein
MNVGNLPIASVGELLPGPLGRNRSPGVAMPVNAVICGRPCGARKNGRMCIRIGAVMCTARECGAAGRGPDEIRRPISLIIATSSWLDDSNRMCRSRSARMCSSLVLPFALAAAERHGSVTAVAARRVEGQQLLEVEFGDCLELVGQARGAEVFRQVVEPGAVFVLQGEQSGDGGRRTLWPRSGSRRRRENRLLALWRSLARRRAWRSAAVIGRVPRRDLGMAECRLAIVTSHLQVGSVMRLVRGAAPCPAAVGRHGRRFSWSARPRQCGHFVG